MKVFVSGQCLSVHQGTSRSGKDYVYADVYDGEDLIKVFGVDPQFPLGECMIECRLDINPDTNKTFFMAVK